MATDGIITERINRHQLVRLLDTMSSLERQAITQRMRVADIEAALPPAVVTESPISGPRYARPFSHVAALLPPVKPLRTPRPTLTGRTVRTLSELAPAPVAVVAPPAEPTLDDKTELSPQVVAQLSSEEIAMLPERLRPAALPEPTLRAEPEAVAAQTDVPWLALALCALFTVAIVVWFVVHASG